MQEGGSPFCLASCCYFPVNTGLPRPFARPPTVAAKLLFSRFFLYDLNPLMCLSGSAQNKSISGPNPKGMPCTLMIGKCDTALPGPIYKTKCRTKEMLL